MRRKLATSIFRLFYSLSLFRNESDAKCLIFYTLYTISLTEESKIHLILGHPPVVYSIEINSNDISKELARIRSLTMNSNKEIVELATIISKSTKRYEENTNANNPTHVRLPAWYSKNNLRVPDAIALLLYFVNEPLTVAKITQLMNSEFNKINLKNVSKYLTSKDSDLYGYTSYDNDSHTYSLNNYGKRQIELELISKIKSSIQLKITSKSSNEMSSP